VFQLTALKGNVTSLPFLPHISLPYAVNQWRSVKYQ